MFTASSNVTRRSRIFGARSGALLLATLVFANLVALAGLGASARAGDFPDALHYAPMTWEKQEPFRFAEPPIETREAAVAVPKAAPVQREQLQPAATPLPNFAEVASEKPAPSVASVARAGDHHRTLLIALMSIALAAMGGVSVMMVRGLSREIVETEGRRSRL